MTKGKKIKLGVRNLFSGDFILNLHLDRYVGLVLTIFLLTIGYIIWNLMVESRLVKIVDGEEKIKELVIYRDQTAIELLELDHRAIVEDLLKKNNSTLTAPTEPAQVIKTER